MLAVIRPSGALSFLPGGPAVGPCGARTGQPRPPGHPALTLLPPGRSWNASTPYGAFLSAIPPDKVPGLYRILRTSRGLPGRRTSAAIFWPCLPVNTRVPFGLLVAPDRDAAWDLLAVQAPALFPDRGRSFFCGIKHFTPSRLRRPHRVTVVWRAPDCVSARWKCALALLARVGPSLWPWARIPMAAGRGQSGVSGPLALGAGEPEPWERSMPPPTRPKQGPGRPGRDAICAPAGGSVGNRLKSLPPWKTMPLWAAGLAGCDLRAVGFRSPRRAPWAAGWLARHKASARPPALGHCGCWRQGPASIPPFWTGRARNRTIVLRVLRPVRVFPSPWLPPGTPILTTGLGPYERTNP